MNKKLILLTIILAMSICNVIAEEHVGDRKPLGKGVPTLKEQVIIVPANTCFSAITTGKLNSNTLLTGQTVTMAIDKDFYYNGNLIFPSASILTGNVVEVERAKQSGLNGKINIRFSLVTTPYGLQIPISAVIKTKDATGVLVGGVDSTTKGEIATNVLKKTETDLLKSVWNFGENVSISPDTVLHIVLVQPVTVNPTVYNKN